jgi:glyoxylase-like metal-dependent hydrolase (beta-lactamase superfamily II)
LWIPSYNVVLSQAAHPRMTTRGIDSRSRQNPSHRDKLLEAGFGVGLERGYCGASVHGAEAVEGFSSIPNPGRTIDHACIRFSSRGEQALFWGDVIHHPLLFVRPNWNSVFCELPDAAGKARRRAMKHAAEPNALVFITHFAESSAGRASRVGDRLTWHFA